MALVTPPAPPNRPPYWWAVATGSVVFLIYLATLAPTTAFWDTSEYIAAAKVVGIPHPPGNPLFVILAQTFGLVPLATSYAVRINLLAALTSAAAAGLWFLVADRWLQAIVAPAIPRRVAGFAGVLAGATLWTVWNQSTVNEKVYTVSLLFTALITWLVIHWSDRAHDPRRDRWLVLIAYLLALTSTNHLMGVLAAPTVLAYVLATDWRALLRWRVVVPVVLVVVVGLTPNTGFLPIRAAALPPINEGEPTGLNAICALTGGLAQCSQPLWDVLHRVQFGKPSVLLRQSPLSAQLGMYWSYFSWQFARDAGSWARAATALFTVLGLGGLWQLLRKDRRAGLAAATTLVTLTVALVFYLNFQYQYSFDLDRVDVTQDLREVRERDYFFLSSFAFFGTLIALGIGAAMSAVVEQLRARVSTRLAWAAALPLGLLALVPLLGNRATASRAHEHTAADFARDLLESVEPYGVLITNGDNDLFPLWFAQEVEGVRPDVTVANMSLMNTNWHLKQLARRPTPAFDPNRSASLWRDLPPPDRAGRWVQPTTPVLRLTEAAIDSLPEIFAAPTQPVKFGNIEINFGSKYLRRRDLATLLLIRDSLGRRPLYFAWSTGTFADQQFGLAPYLVSQGFVRRLNDGPVRAIAPVVVTPGLGLVDVDRTEALLWNVYRPESAARRRPHGWIDEPSRNIPELYQFAYNVLAAALRQQGDTARAVRADSVARSVAAGLRAGF
jgi:hypothetical protein